MRCAGALTVCAAIAIMFSIPGQAHKGITSKFTYNDDVFPVFLNRCSRCHVDGGVGPMSLLKYQEAFPWAESLRTELLAAASMPEANSEPPEFEFVKAAHRQISAKELDIVLDWATGGTPEGDPGKTPSAPATVEPAWARETPDLVVSLEHPFEIPADAVEKTQVFELTVPVGQPQNAVEVDVLPGNPSIVRIVMLSLRSKDGEVRPLGVWFPRQSPQPLSLRPAARLEPGSQLVARIHYKKNWKLEGEAASDQSAVGFYFGK